MVALVILSIPSAIAYDFEVGGIYYNIESTTDLSVSVTYGDTYSGTYSGSIAIPSSVTYSDKTFEISNIGDSAFYECSSLTDITLPNSLTSIGKMVFTSCTSLTSIVFPNNLTSLGEYAFSNCT